MAKEEETETKLKVEGGDDKFAIEIGRLTFTVVKTVIEQFGLTIHVIHCDEYPNWRYVAKSKEETHAFLRGVFIGNEGSIDM